MGVPPAHQGEADRGQRCSQGPARYASYRLRWSWAVAHTPKKRAAAAAHAGADAAASIHSRDSPMQRPQVEQAPLTKNAYAFNPEVATMRAQKCSNPTHPRQVGPLQVTSRLLRVGTSRPHKHASGAPPHLTLRQQSWGSHAAASTSSPTNSLLASQP